MRNVITSLLIFWVPLLVLWFIIFGINWVDSKIKNHHQEYTSNEKEAKLKKLVLKNQVKISSNNRYFDGIVFLYKVESNRHELEVVKIVDYLPISF